MILPTARVTLRSTREVGKITGTIGYGLLWNWRKFDDLNQGVKFPAKFDNRHKININASYKLNEKIEFNAGWTFTTGNRMTLSTYNYDVPGTMFPDAPSPGPPGWETTTKWKAWIYTRHATTYAYPQTIDSISE